MIRPNLSRAASDRSRSRSISISEESKSPLPPGMNHIDIVDGFTETRNRSPAIGEEGLSPVERSSNLSQSAPNVHKDHLEIDEKDEVFPRSLEDGMKSLQMIQDGDFRASSSSYHPDGNTRSGCGMIGLGISERTIGSVTPSVLDISVLNSEEHRRAKTASTLNRYRKDPVDDYRTSLARSGPITGRGSPGSPGSPTQRTTKAISMVMEQRPKVSQGKRAGKQYLQVGIKVTGRKR